MEYNISKPSMFLSQYIKYYWSIENCMPAGKEHIQRIVPNGLFEMIFYFGNKPKTTDPNKAINDNIILTGQLKNYHDLKVTGNLSLFAIYFLPNGISMFLDLPIKETFNYSIPLRLLIKDKVNQLEDDLSLAETFEQRIAISENFLITQIQKNEKKYKYDRIRNVINHINQAKGIIDIEDLASKTFLSRKQFERTFSDFIGTSPKQFLKVVRFQNAIYEKSKNTELNLTEIAHKCGYFDQSHMINEFKALSGRTPTDYFENGDYFSDYFG
ncbi:AraC family transcriptional regulator [Carboxylicivirga linearis]|uniref:AraC family transcriptional regulator n=1 Tax=Carboxylicivirga linearis TaxID=1628157 RepID=A0ABS5JVA2_9BACT|nr:helix-turn-helix domain-containing protein [Carboxylicivirga linearis]MBS2098409.1 AraC family transcriptional regulator [Carboxylicivirga linearis]